MKDSRYSINREFCGFRRPRHVARFCGDWIGQARSHVGAAALVELHKASRATGPAAAFIAAPIGDTMRAIREAGRKWHSFSACLGGAWHYLEDGRGSVDSEPAGRTYAQAAAVIAAETLPAKRDRASLAFHIVSAMQAGARR